MTQVSRKRPESDDMEIDEMEKRSRLAEHFQQEPAAAPDVEGCREQ